MKPACFFVLLLSASIAATAQTNVPNTFGPNTSIKSSEVNANFQALAAAVDKGVPGYQFIQQSFTVPANTTIMAQFSVTCPAGKVIISGG